MSIPSSDTAPRLLSIHDAAKYLGEIGAGAVSVNFIRTIIASGQIPHLKIGRKFFVTVDSIRRWIETREKRTR
jgi:excisionase family DNA binding protein